jgi:hypothetical protein
MKILSVEELEDSLDPEPEQRFFQFAFRGMCVVKIYEAIKGRLLVNRVILNLRDVGRLPYLVGKPYITMHYGHKMPLLCGDKIMDFGAWLEWKEAGGRDLWEEVTSDDWYTRVEALLWKEAKYDWSLRLEDSGTLIRGRIFICRSDICFVDVVV